MTDRLMNDFSAAEIKRIQHILAAPFGKAKNTARLNTQFRAYKSDQKLTLRSTDYENNAAHHHDLRNDVATQLNEVQVKVNHEMANIQ